MRLIHKNTLFFPCPAERVFSAILDLLLLDAGLPIAEVSNNALKESEYPYGLWIGRQNHVLEVLDFVSKGKKTFSFAV